MVSTSHPFISPSITMSLPPSSPEASPESPSPVASEPRVATIAGIKSHEVWRGPLLVILNERDLAIAKVPIDFLTTSGVGSTYGALGQLLEPLFDSDSSLGPDDTPLQWRGVDGALISTEDQVTEGEVVVARSGVASALVPCYTDAPSEAPSSQSGSPARSGARSQTGSDSVRNDDPYGHTNFASHSEVPS